MNRNRFRWLINPLFLLVTATCGNTSLQGGNCASDVDSDSDGLNDDIECQIGTDPKNPDFNGDGLSDGEAVKLGLDPKKLDAKVRKKCVCESVIGFCRLEARKQFVDGKNQVRKVPLEGESAPVSAAVSVTPASPLPHMVLTLEDKKHTPEYYPKSRH